jgi:hypothetical protein
LKNLILIFFLIKIVYSQPTEIKTYNVNFDADKFWGVDKYNSIYLSKNNTIYKQENESVMNFQDFESGEIESISVYNPLNIGVFYKNTNRFIQLDNKLNPISKVNFLKSQDLKTITFASLTYHDSIWVFNENSTCLELFSIKENKTLLRSIPINDTVLDMNSTINNCWILTSNNILKYNYLGQLELKVKNLGCTKIKSSSKFVILQKENKLYKLEKSSLKELFLPVNIIENFSVNEEYLYIYNSNKLHKIKI